MATTHGVELHGVSVGQVMNCLFIFWLGKCIITQHYVVNEANISSICCYLMY